MNRASLLAAPLLLITCSAAYHSDLVTIRGTAVRVDPDGAEHRELDGSFLLAVQQAESLSKRIEVEAGRWSARVPEWAFLRPLELELGGRDVLLFAEWSRAQTGALLELRGELVQSATVLRVFAADDGRELDQLEIVATGTYSEHPGPIHAGDRILASASSPVTLSLRDIEEHSPGRVSWVRAPGRAWKSIRCVAASSASNCRSAESSNSSSSGQRW